MNESKTTPNDDDLSDAQRRVHAIATDCPCGSHVKFSDCCGRFLSGLALADTPEQLMRSRFSAFALGHFEDYLLKTWHPKYCPVQTAEELARDPVAWQKLEIREHSEQGDQGMVTFCAWFRDGQGLHPYVERSQFVRVNGEWLYTEGESLPYQKTVKIKPNDPCPCGSGKKYKKCCGSRG